MININFVPDDYVQANESRRTNIMYLILLLVVMAGLGGVFMTIKMRQRAVLAQEQLVNSKMAKAQESIKRFEELQAKRKDMMKTALTTSELIEPVPRTVLLASLTNNLPSGVSLLKLNLVQKEAPMPKAAAVVAESKYKQSKGKKDGKPEAVISKERLLETHIDITGMAPSDLQVAGYIERLENSHLLDNVALVESKEYEIDEMAYRQFKLKAILGKDVHLSDEDIERLRVTSQKRAFGS